MIARSWGCVSFELRCRQSCQIQDGHGHCSRPQVQASTLCGRGSCTRKHPARFGMCLLAALRVTKGRKLKQDEETSSLSSNVQDQSRLAEVDAWLKDGAKVLIAVTNQGLEGPVARELQHYHAVASVVLSNRLYFRWSGEGRSPAVHGASRLVVLFGLVWGRALEELQRSEEDLHSAFARIVERAAIARLRSVLPVFMSRFAEDPDDPGANPPGRKIRFTAQCRVNYSGAEKEAFGPRADWVKLKTAVRSGLERATSWVLEPRAAAAEVNATVFFAADHVAFGVEVKELEMRPALPFSWSRLARPGMQTQIAGAMAAVAAECMIDAEIEGTQPSIVVDPTCGMGTLLLAAARIWPQVSQRPLRLVGRETSSSQLQKCLSNFAACCVDARRAEV